MEASIDTLLIAGAKLMLIGMGIVFLFLMALVWIIGFTARLIRRYDPETINQKGNSSAGVEFAPGEAEAIAAIAVAVNRFRNHQTGSQSP